MIQLIQATVIEVSKLTERIQELRLGARAGGVLPRFDAGAHIGVDLPAGDKRCYSLITLPDASDQMTEYRIAVQLEPGGNGGSRYMHGLAAGDAVSFVPPKNDFELDEAAPAFLLGGGIGVTPLISMATKLLAQGRAFEFHYAARSQEVMAYRDVLATGFGGHLHLHCDDDPKTELNLQTLIGGIDAQTHLYVCGPPAMLEAVRAKAEVAGINADRIHFEVFATPEAQDGDTAFEVELSSSGQVFEIQPGQTIVEVLDDAGIDIMFDCQRGDCGICQTDVISGVPDHRDVVLSPDEKAAGDVMQICVSRSKSPRLVLDI